MRIPKVEIYHPELDRTALVPAESVSAWAQSGWTAVDDERDEDQLELDLDDDDPVTPDAEKE